MEKDEKKRMPDTNSEPLFIYALFEHCSFSANASLFFSEHCS
jgi:hypothetical protein